VVIQARRGATGSIHAANEIQLCWRWSSTVRPARSSISTHPVAVKRDATRTPSHSGRIRRATRIAG
jgi:hypothetical protein